jgi:hypothetical protein
MIYLINWTTSESLGSISSDSVSKLNYIRKRYWRAGVDYYRSGY